MHKTIATAKRGQFILSAALPLQWLGQLSPSARRTLGAGLGDVARWVGIRRRIAARNLQLVFPQMSEEERAELLRRHFRCLGAALMDEFGLLNLSAEDIRRYLPFAADSEPRPSRPTIFCSPHFAAATIGGVRLSASPAGENLAFLYRPMHSRFWNNFYGRLRGQYSAAAIAANSPDAMRRCARHLRGGGSLFYLPDIDARRRKSAVFAPFMGVAAATTTALSRLAALGGAQVRMFSARMQDANGGYDLQLSPPLSDFPGDDAAADAARINELIAEQVRIAPAQYYWLHRRFKTRPPGEEAVYD